MPDRERDYRFLIWGSTRAQIASALLEYRAFVRDHPDDELAPFLASTIAHVRTALKQRRRTERATGIRTWA